MPYEIRSAGVTREAETMEHAERIAIHLCAATRAETTISRDGKEVARLAHEAPAAPQLRRLSEPRTPDLGDPYAFR